MNFPQVFGKQLVYCGYSHVTHIHGSRSGRTLTKPCITTCEDIFEVFLIIFTRQTEGMVLQPADQNLCCSFPCDLSLL